jgi:ATP-dependent Lon protease
MSERPALAHPALEMLKFDRWDTACAWLHGKTTDMAPRWRLDGVMAMVADRKAVRAVILLLIEDLYAEATLATGQLALAWQLLTVDPGRPQSFHAVLPQLQYALDDADIEEHVESELRERIRIWWRGAEGAFRSAEVSIFRIAELETKGDPDFDEEEPVIFAPKKQPGPTLVVMPKSKATKLNNFHATYKDILDAALPLVVARDVQGIRLSLQREFPHATVAVDLMLRDLREGQPVALKPICLVSAPGAGKSRLVRRLANLVRNLYVYRFGASSSSDSHFGGTSKAWSNTEPSVPARAVAQSRTANPMVLIDEIDKAAERNTNGRLWDSVLAFLDVETACRYRDQSLDSELDLSAVIYAATANDVSKLPPPLKDRLRIIRVPSPTLAHLAPLAAQVMRDIAIEDEARAHDSPLAGDELEVIGRAWAKAGFSMRKLQKIVGATLEARDSYAMRH